MKKGPRGRDDGRRGEAAAHGGATESPGNTNRDLPAQLTAMSYPIYFKEPVRVRACPACEQRETPHRERRIY